MTYDEYPDEELVYEFYAKVLTDSLTYDRDIELLEFLQDKAVAKLLSHDISPGGSLYNYLTGLREPTSMLSAKTLDIEALEENLEYFNRYYDLMTAPERQRKTFRFRESREGRNRGLRAFLLYPDLIYHCLEETADTGRERGFTVFLQQDGKHIPDDRRGTNDYLDLATQLEEDYGEGELVVSFHTHYDDTRISIEDLIATIDEGLEELFLGVAEPRRVYYIKIRDSEELREVVSLYYLYAFTVEDPDLDIDCKEYREATTYLYDHYTDIVSQTDISDMIDVTEEDLNRIKELLEEDLGT